MSIEQGEAIRDQLYAHLAKEKIKVDEGGSSPPVLSYLIELVERRRPVHIGEIGFNAGLSSFAFLSASPETQVVSFDLGHHRCVAAAKNYLDARFPKRHTLVLGDSRVAVPRYKAEHPKSCFDLVFVDGGHSFEIARADLLNLKPLCSPRTAVVMDDLTPWQYWGTGPMKAWASVLKDGIVVEDELLKDGQKVTEMKLPGKRGWALGHFKE